MRFRVLAAAVSAALLFSGCSLLKDDADTQVAYSDPMDESWYTDPVQEAEPRAEAAQARPLTDRAPRIEDNENARTPEPVRDPGWETEIDSSAGRVSSLPDLDKDPSEATGIVGAPVRDSAGAASKNSALVATRSGVGSDAGDSYSGLANSPPMSSQDSGPPGLRLNVSAPPALTGDSTDADTGFGAAAPSGFGSATQSNTFAHGPVPSPEPVDPTFDDSTGRSEPVARYDAPAMTVAPPPDRPANQDPMSLQIPRNRPGPGSTVAPDLPREPVPDAESLKEAAVTQYKSRNYAESTRLFRQFQDAYPEQSTDWIQWHLSQSLLEQGLWGEAGEEFRKLVGSPNSELRAEALLKLGIIDEKRGNFDLAKNRWNRVLEQYPDTKAAKRAAEEISKNRP